jgi:hypothetical protein
MVGACVCGYAPRWHTNDNAARSLPVDLTECTYTRELAECKVQSLSSTCDDEERWWRAAEAAKHSTRSWSGTSPICIHRISNSWCAAAVAENNPRQTSAFLKLPPSLVADYPLVLAEIRGGCLFCIAPHSLADSTSYLGWANIPNGPARSRLLHPVPSADAKKCLGFYQG